MFLLILCLLIYYRDVYLSPISQVFREYVFIDSAENPIQPCILKLLWNKESWLLTKDLRIHWWLKLFWLLHIMIPCFVIVLMFLFFLSVLMMIMLKERYWFLFDLFCYRNRQVNLTLRLMNLRVLQAWITYRLFLFLLFSCSLDLLLFIRFPVIPLWR